VGRDEAKTEGQAIRCRLIEQDDHDEARNSLEAKKMKELGLKLEDLPEVLDVIDIVKFLRISKNNAYDLIKARKFHSVTIGRRIKIPKQSFVKW
jgi:hypothetical protein